MRTRTVFFTFPPPRRSFRVTHVVQSPSYTVGQVIFIRTDTPDYAEESVPFKTLEEMAVICSRPVPDRVLEKILVYSMIDNEPVALTFGFVAASRGQRPQNPDLVND